MEKMEKIKCAVIGGNGFLGFEIANYLLSKNDEVICFGIDLENCDRSTGLNFEFLDITNREMCFEKLKGFDEVYNCAGVLGTFVN